MAQRKVKLRRKHADPGEGVSTAYVQRAIQEQLAALGLLEFLQWRAEVEDRIARIRIALLEVRGAVQLVGSSAGSVRSQMNELLPLMEGALQEIEIGQSSRLNRIESPIQPLLPDDARIDTDNYDDPMDDLDL